MFSGDPEKRPNRRLFTYVAADHFVVDRVSSLITVPACFLIPSQSESYSVMIGTESTNFQTHFDLSAIFELI